MTPRGYRAAYDQFEAEINPVIGPLLFPGSIEAADRTQLRGLSSGALGYLIRHLQVLINAAAQELDQRSKAVTE